MFIILTHDFITNKQSIKIYKPVWLLKPSIVTMGIPNDRALTAFPEEEFRSSTINQVVFLLTEFVTSPPAFLIHSSNSRSRIPVKHIFIPTNRHPVSSSSQSIGILFSFTYKINSLS